MGIAWPNPLRTPSGDWGVTLPANASIGELLVYAEAATGIIPPGYRWKCDETALPLLEASGYDHTLTAVSSADSTPGTTMGFGRPSMRLDGTGHAITEATGHNMTGVWTPAQTAGTGDFTLACLIAQDGSISTANNIFLTAAGFIRIGYYKHPPAGTQNPPEMAVWNGSGWTVVSSGSLSPTSGTEHFFALRCAAGGASSAWKAWQGDGTASGTTGVYTPDPTSWHIELEINDPNGYRIQEIQAWNMALSDADIEALRFSLIGV